LAGRTNRFRQNCARRNTPKAGQQKTRTKAFAGHFGSVAESGPSALGFASIASCDRPARHNDFFNQSRWKSDIRHLHQSDHRRRRTELPGRIR
jgi:hypothetical protein